MIGQITKGSGFGRLFRYLLKPDKDAEIIDSNASSETCEDLAREFELVSAQNPNVERNVTHISIAFAGEDGEIDKETKARIGQRIAKALGHDNSLYVTIAHGRSDPGHRQEHDHDHMHIALTSIDLDGRWVDDGWNFRKLEAELRKIEKDEGFREIESSWEARKSAPTKGQRQRVERELVELGEAALPVSNRLQAQIRQAATESETVGEFAQRLAREGIESKLKITRTGKVRGISYQMEGVGFQGSQLYDASLPKLQSVYGLTVKSQDIAEIRRGFDSLRSLPLPKRESKEKDDEQESGSEEVATESRESQVSEGGDLRSLVVSGPKSAEQRAPKELIEGEIKAAAGGAADVTEFARILAEKQIEMRVRVSRQNRVTGISYEFDGANFSGGTVGGSVDALRSMGIPLTRNVVEAINGSSRKPVETLLKKERVEQRMRLKPRIGHILNCSSTLLEYAHNLMENGIKVKMIVNGQKLRINYSTPEASFSGTELGGNQAILKFRGWDLGASSVESANAVWPEETTADTDNRLSATILRANNQSKLDQSIPGIDREMNAIKPVPAIKKDMQIHADELSWGTHILDTQMQEPDSANTPKKNPKAKKVPKSKRQRGVQM